MPISRWVEKDVARICSGRSLSHKKGQNNAVYSNRDGPRDSFYASQKEKGKYHDVTCKWKLKHNAEELITKQKHSENRLVVAKREGWWPKDGLGVWDYYVQDGQTARSYRRAQGTVFYIL